MIWELGEESPKWIHVTYREGKNRNQILQAYRDLNGSINYKMYEQRKEKQKEVQGNKTRSVPARKVRSVSDSS